MTRAAPRAATPRTVQATGRGHPLAFAVAAVIRAPPGGQLTRLTADSAADAWAVCSASTAGGPTTLIFHWGMTWSRVTSPDPCGSNAENELSSVTATSPASAWAADGYGKTLLLRWNGKTWSQADAWAAGSWTGTASQPARGSRADAGPGVPGACGGTGAHGG
jgi:hypothetical protein